MKTNAKVLWIALSFLGLSLATLLIFSFVPDKSLEQLKPKYVNAESKFWKHDGMSVHYRDQGNRQDSLPLVLIHGTSSSLHTWEAMVQEMKGKHRLVSLDLPGFGLTGPKANAYYSYAYYAEFLQAFMQHLGLKKVVLVGNSLGGSIAWHMALAKPELVARMVLMDAGGYPMEGKPSSLGFWLASTPVISQLMLYATPKFLIRKSLEGIYADPAQITEERVQWLQDMAVRAGNRAALLHMFQHPRISQHEAIKRIQTPTLIVWGEEDQLIDVKNAYRFKVDLKNSQLVVLKNIGHVPSDECPKELAKLLENYLAQP